MERNNYMAVVTGAAVVFMGMLLCDVGIVLGEAIQTGRDDVGDNVEHAQQYNAQLLRQLDLGHNAVNHLLVKVSDNSFSFETVDATGQAEKCSGSYSLKHDVATTTGKLSCVQMVPLTR